MLSIQTAMPDESPPMPLSLSLSLSLLTALRHTLTTLALLATAAGPALAKPVSYQMDTTGSTVAFETDFGANPISGSMPVDTADLILDFDAVATSRIDVTLSAKGARASFPFAAEAMKGASVLDTTRHPQIHFRSTRITAQGDGATVKGNVTIRGVTRPLTLDATIFRQTGAAKGDRSRLTVRLTGAIRRSAFGAVGFADLVGDEVRLDIRARIHQRP